MLPLCDMLEDWWFSNEQVMNVSMPTRLGKTYLGTYFQFGFCFIRLIKDLAMFIFCNFSNRKFNTNKKRLFKLSG